MTRCLDRWLTRTRKPGYLCWHFAAEVWAAEFGGDMLADLQAVLASRGRPTPGRRSFTRLAGPISPCLALFTARAGRTHVGLWIDGSVLHLQRAAQYVPLDVVLLGFQNVRFYRYA